MRPRCRAVGVCAGARSGATRSGHQRIKGAILDYCLRLVEEAVAEAEKGRHVMELNPDTVVGRHCRLVRPVRDIQGKSRFSEEPVILRAVNNLGRHMYLVQFDDGSTTFLFPNEIIVQN